MFLFCVRKTRAQRQASIAAFTILTAIVLATFRSYGVANDEGIQQTHGKLLRFYASSFTDDNAFHYCNLYLYSGLFDLVAAGIGLHLSMPTYEWRHLLSVIVGWWGCGSSSACPRRTNEVVSPWCCSPPLARGGAPFNEIKDISFAAR